MQPPGTLFAGLVIMVWYGMVWYGMVWYGMVHYITLQIMTQFAGHINLAQRQPQLAVFCIHANSCRPCCPPAAAC
jgi:hypothetical protein